MEFNIAETVEILRRTPFVLEAMLKGLSREWLEGNEGENTWSPHIVLGHLIIAEENNWIPRLSKIVSGSDNKFAPFDRFAQVTLYKDTPTQDLLKKFSDARKQSLLTLSTIPLEQEKFDWKGIHPDLGEVTLGQLLSTWTVHDLDHINQISRVMAKQYADAVGPWKNYLGVLKRPI
ncbi:MAG TPA: DinB family protein [Chryseolinea sp.]